MSSIEMKSNLLENTSSYPLVAPQHEEIDLLSLLSTLYAAKKQIVTITLLFALCGLAASFLLPQKWTSEAVITPPENSNIIELRRAVVDLTVLGVETNLDASRLYNKFLKKFDSQEVREKFLAQSPYVQTLLKNPNVDKSDLYRAIVNVSAKFKALDNSDPKKSENLPYTSWTLSFTAPDADDAQQLLKSYIDFVSAEVNKDVITNVKNAIELKVAFEKNKLALDRVNLQNQHNVNLERLGYSLQVANAAGLEKPVYSNGQAVKDDPDYSVSLGSKGLTEKLKIEQSIKDVAQMNASLQNREHALSQLESINLGNVDFTPYQLQMQPSYPLKKDGPGKALIIILAGLVGVIVASGLVLVRGALASRMRIEEI
ncbi:LPS O-antigen length regulator Wzz(fepE) [Buttiauxella agrestis]|uniref:Ferric enterobactin uptake protein n=1 Tax=Buttiauxella agrestis ATCC 33320 TaxID=1006004 RepID=A0A085G4A2_9ENTR|nr:LPS O-antigen length regulator Wzz(fepE) [Buttiauxella agrestis]KFC78547.1 ferric enterobactin uptake protein [Buttiauxella agrestis ATCC 33320]